MKLRIQIYIGLILLLLAAGCENNNTNQPINHNSRVEVKVGDTRIIQTETKNARKTTNVIKPNKLNQFEVNITEIELIKTDGKVIPLITEPEIIDLRDFQGIFSKISTAEIELGNYKKLVIQIEGISIKYDNNSYTASTSVAPKIMIGSINQSFTINEQNPFENPIKIESPLNLNITHESSAPNIRISIDALSSCIEQTYESPIGQIHFASINGNLYHEIILEENIQQIRYSPPKGLTADFDGNVEYYGIHTFVDFEESGGEITNHTSQHVYRGTDGTLSINVEEMDNNDKPLSSSTINSIGESDILSYENFNTSEYVTVLKNKGIIINPDSSYYFSLRKKWTINSDGRTYELTRMCEPIPIVFPY
ncbi:MAG: hypothetical protein N4A74_02750 [Carboxylicivirga sp.]|jgi:hypothetical protein|nr:hypothetical protein [Carboxylicivirga sp.]